MGRETGEIDLFGIAVSLVFQAGEEDWELVKEEMESRVACFALRITISVW
jgi:hypothetical protein